MKPISTPWLQALAALALTLPAAPLLAQPATKALGEGTPSAGPIMTREELRSCMKRQERLPVLRDQVEAERQALDAEKAAILAETNALQGERGKVTAAGADVKSINERTAEVARKIDDWNKRYQEFVNERRSGPFAERKMRAFKSERAEIEAENEALDAERAKSSGVQGDAAAFNQRAAALENRVRAWNERNAAAVKSSEAAARERDLWAGECGNRRYLIDDEAAIRAGQ